jgi:hypothetical protein
MKDLEIVVYWGGEQSGFINEWKTEQRAKGTKTI